MGSSIHNGRVQLFLQNSLTSITMPTAQDVSGTDYAGLLAQNRINLSRSALQRPEINRAHLASMLRKTLKKDKTQKAQKTDWSAFLTGYVKKNANNNDVSE
ncbi:MAG: hypothetical protein CO093_06600 [Alphaproteobacteria bacterium CG_4_9_14_3_um_filter_47_13]|nr:MAG: hypothetical protein CO093_06600 [Alphaproteobacteria bacterium CG_4_9_14_3_um_filter_47_13]